MTQVKLCNRKLVIYTLGSRKLEKRRKEKGGWCSGPASSNPTWIEYLAVNMMHTLNGEEAQNFSKYIQLVSGIDMTHVDILCVQTII